MQRIKKLIRHNLDYKKAILYAKDQLKIDHVLSRELNLLNFEKGQFFTLLPKDADINRIYDFFDGLILPQNETKLQMDKITRKVKGYYTLIPTLEDEVSFLISEEVKQKNNYVVIFEDVQQELTSPHIEFFHQFGFSCFNQMYYFLTNVNASPSMIYEAMREVDAIWHQLFIVTEVESEFINQFKPGQEITADVLQKFVSNIRLLVLGAYDGEGYFFWEPSQVPFFHNVFMKTV